MMNHDGTFNVARKGQRLLESLNVFHWLLNLSVFQLYGTPLLSGIYWTGLWAMVAVVVVGFGAATLLMERRELSR